MMTVYGFGTIRDGDGWWAIENIDGDVVFFGRPPDGRAFVDEQDALQAMATGQMTRRPDLTRGVDIREA